MDINWERGGMSSYKESSSYSEKKSGFLTFQDSQEKRKMEEEIDSPLRESVIKTAYIYF